MSSKLPSLSTREVISILRSIGFTDAPFRGKGSHHALTKTDLNGIIRLVIVPECHEIPKGTLMSIIKQAGLTREEFIHLFP